MKSNKKVQVIAALAVSLLSIGVFVVIHKTVGLVSRGSLLGGGLGFAYIAANCYFSLKRNTKAINVLLGLLILGAITLKLLDYLVISGTVSPEFSMKADILAGMGSFLGTMLLLLAFMAWFKILFKKDLFKNS